MNIAKVELLALVKRNFGFRISCVFAPNCVNPSDIAAMFAVKGWAVDAASLKPQTEVFKRSKPSEQNEAQDGEKVSRKRKREQNAGAAPEVDIGKQWEKHIEGKGVGKAKGQTKKDKLKQKREQKAAGDEVNGLPVGEKPLKETKAQDERPKDEVKAIKGEKKNKKKRKQENGEAQTEAGAAASKPSKTPAASVPPSAPPPLPATAKLTPMQAAMRQKLISARFRHLNETLYTAPSDSALELFSSNPEMFEDYHAGFRQQVEVWPENPLDNFLATIRQRGKVKQPMSKGGSRAVDPATGTAPLPRTHGTSIIADLGCGDARLASTLTSSNEVQNLHLKLHSFDLHSPSKHVTKADISSLPLEDNSVDVALFCLALMGTNWISFIEEAYRILHWKGELWVSEIKSRFGRVGKGGKGKVVEHSVGSKRKAAALAKVKEAKKKKEDEINEQNVLATEVDGVQTQQQETDVSAFVELLRRRGFVLKDGDNSIDLSNKMFVKMEFMKAAAPTKGKGVASVPVEKREKMGKQKKFLADGKAPEEEIDTDDEAKVLKPCLYKIR